MLLFLDGLVLAFWSKYNPSKHNVGSGGGETLPRSSCRETFTWGNHLHWTMEHCVNGISGGARATRGCKNEWMDRNSDMTGKCGRGSELQAVKPFLLFNNIVWFQLKIRRNNHIVFQCRRLVSSYKYLCIALLSEQSATHSAVRWNSNRECLYCIDISNICWHLSTRTDERAKVVSTINLSCLWYRFPTTDNHQIIRGLFHSKGKPLICSTRFPLCL